MMGCALPGLIHAYILNAADPGMPEHTNDYIHYLDLRRGQLRVRENEHETIYRAPAMIQLHAHLPHSWQAVVDGTIVYNLHPPQGVAHDDER